MADGKRRTKRGKGRPQTGQSGVGRAALVEAARQLLQELPPSQVTASAIARRAGGDPALVRYYFGNREALLLEVVQQIGHENASKRPAEGDPEDLLRDFIHATFQFTRSARNMQRLMVEELDSTRSPELRENVRSWNRGPLEQYEQIKQLDAEGKLIDFDPLFLHLAVVGISDFFVTGRPLIELLAGDGTDLDKLAADYEAFVERLLLNGLLRR